MNVNGALRIEARTVNGKPGIFIVREDDSATGGSTNKTRKNPTKAASSSARSSTRSSLLSQSLDAKGRSTQSADRRKSTRSGRLSQSRDGGSAARLSQTEYKRVLEVLGKDTSPRSSDAAKSDVNSSSKTDERDLLNGGMEDTSAQEPSVMEVTGQGVVLESPSRSYLGNSSFHHTANSLHQHLGSVTLPNTSPHGDRSLHGQLDTSPHQPVIDGRHKNERNHTPPHLPPLTKLEKKKLEWRQQQLEQLQMREYNPWGRPGGGAPPAPLKQASPLQIPLERHHSARVPPITDVPTMPRSSHSAPLTRAALPATNGDQEFGLIPGMMREEKPKHDKRQWLRELEKQIEDSKHQKEKQRQLDEMFEAWSQGGSALPSRNYIRSLSSPHEAPVAPPIVQNGINSANELKSNWGRFYIGDEANSPPNPNEQRHVSPSSGVEVNESNTLPNGGRVVSAQVSPWASRVGSGRVLQPMEDLIERSVDGMPRSWSMGDMPRSHHRGQHVFMDPQAFIEMEERKRKQAEFQKTLEQQVAQKQREKEKEKQVDSEQRIGLPSSVGDVENLSRRRSFPRQPSHESETFGDVVSPDDRLSHGEKLSNGEFQRRLVTQSHNFESGDQSRNLKQEEVKGQLFREEQILAYQNFHQTSPVADYQGHSQTMPVRSSQQLLGYKGQSQELFSQGRVNGGRFAISSDEHHLPRDRLPQSVAVDRLPAVQHAQSSPGQSSAGKVRGQSSAGKVQDQSSLSNLQDHDSPSNVERSYSLDAVRQDSNPRSFHRGQHAFYDPETRDRMDEKRRKQAEFQAAIQQQVEEKRRQKAEEERQRREEEMKLEREVAERYQPEPPKPISQELVQRAEPSLHQESMEEHNRPPVASTRHRVLKKRGSRTSQQGSRLNSKAKTRDVSPGESVRSSVFSTDVSQRQSDDDGSIVTEMTASVKDMACQTEDTEDLPVPLHTAGYRKARKPRESKERPEWGTNRGKKSVPNSQRDPYYEKHRKEREARLARRMEELRQQAEAQAPKLHTATRASRDGESSRMKMNGRSYSPEQQEEEEEKEEEESSSEEGADVPPPPRSYSPPVPAVLKNAVQLPALPGRQSPVLPSGGRQMSNREQTRDSGSDSPPASAVRRSEVPSSGGKQNEQKDDVSSSAYGSSGSFRSTSPPVPAVYHRSQMNEQARHGSGGSGEYRRRGNGDDASIASSFNIHQYNGRSESALSTDSSNRAKNALLHPELFQTRPTERQDLILQQLSHLREGLLLKQHEFSRMSPNDFPRYGPNNRLTSATWQTSSSDGDSTISKE